MTALHTLSTAFICLAVTCSACTRTKENAGGLSPGQRVFKKTESPSQANGIQIRSHISDSWAAQLARKPAGPWKVVRTPEGIDYLDDRANSSLINHFLDTLDTLMISEVLTGQQNSETLGLDPPQFEFELMVGTRSIVLQFGKSTANSRGQYARISRDSDAPILVVEGAARELLPHLSAAHSLRQRQLLDFGLDDIQQISIERAPCTLRCQVFGQRQGGDWADKNQRMLKTEFADFLEQLANLQVSSFIDDPDTAKKLKEQILKKTRFKAVFTGLGGITTTLLMADFDDTESLAWLSSHDPAVYKAAKSGLAVLSRFFGE